MKHNQFIKNEILTRQVSSMKKEIKDMQEHVIQLEKTLAECPFTRDWFKLQEEAGTSKTDMETSL